MSQEPKPQEEDLTPFDFFLDWYLSVPPEMADELAMIFSNLAPEGWLSIVKQVPTHEDGDWAYQLGKRLVLLDRKSRNSAAEEGLILILCTLVDSIMNRSPEYWIEAREAFEDMRERARRTGKQEQEEVFQRQLDELRLKEKRWNRYAESWQELRETTLSFRTIQRWVNYKRERNYKTA